MGWASAVGVLQHAHRRLALRSPLSGGAGLLGRCEIRRDTIFPDLEDEDALWSLYLDDTSLLEVMSARVAKELEGKPSEEQKRLRQAYAHWGIPVSMDKAVERQAKAEKLGAVIDGERGLLKGATVRALGGLSLGFWLLRQDAVPRKALQVFVGREVHTMQFRRPLFGTFDYLWKVISDGGALAELDGKAVEEVLLSGMCQPLRVTDLRSRLDAVVTASDASETGGGLVYSSKLTSEGVKELVALEEGLDELPAEDCRMDEEEVILVIDLFAGIGGLSRALQLAKVVVNRLIVVEQDQDCRRLNAARWPGCDLVVNVRKITKKDVEKWLRGVPGITGVVTGGGSPCQGLSQLSVNRRHLEDPRSGLFFDLVRVMGWIEEIAEEMGIWTIQMVENVVADDEDIAAMSDALGGRPLRACASGLSWVRRPRLYWSNVELEEHESFTSLAHELYMEVEFREELEPLEKAIDEGFHWPGGEKEPSRRLPTFTRAIPRVRPPAQPAGLDTCDEETVRRWQLDSMMFPPYTYRQEYLIESRSDPTVKRVASVTEGALQERRHQSCGGWGAAGEENGCPGEQLPHGHGGLPVGPLVMEPRGQDRPNWSAPNCAGVARWVRAARDGLLWHNYCWERKPWRHNVRNGSRRGTGHLWEE